MPCILRSCLVRRDGSSAVEFAIIAPVFIAVLLAILGYAIYFSASSSVQQFSEDAVRAAVAGLSPDERQELAEDAVEAASRERAFIDPARLQVAVSSSPIDPDRVSVKITYDASHLPIWSLFSYAMPFSKTISRTSVIRVGGV